MSVLRSTGSLPATVDLEALREFRAEPRTLEGPDEPPDQPPDAGGADDASAQEGGEGDDGSE